MIIVWGSKIRREERGYCADYCASCSQVLPWQVTDLYRVSHLYYIPLGSGKHVGTELKCTSCECENVLEPTPDLAAHYDKDNLDGMLANVHPDVIASWDKQLEQDRKAVEDPNSLSADERMDQIVGKFAGMEPTVAQALQSGPNIGATDFLLGAVWFALITLMFYFGETLSKLPPFDSLIRSLGVDALGFGMIVTLVTGVLLLIWVVASYPSRYFSRKVYPVLARNLVPLNPTWDELEAVKGILKENKCKLAKINMTKLEAAMAEQRGDV